MQDSFKHVWEAIRAFDYLKALQLLEQLQVNNDDDKRNQKALKAMVLAKLGRFEEAISQAQNIIETTTPIANDYNLLGNLYSQTKQYDLAETAYLNAIKLENHYVSALLNLAQLYYKRQDLEKAADLYQQILQINRNHTDAAYYLSSIYLKLNDTEKALAVIEVFDIKLIDDTRLLNQWTQCHYLLANYQQIIDKLENHIFNDSQAIDALWYLASAYYQTKHYQAAIACAEAIKQFDPIYNQINALLGHCYLQLNDYEQALKYYLQENEQSKDAEIYFNIAVIMEAKQRQKEALEYYKEAICLSPDYFDAYCNMANLYLSQGAFDHAKDAYANALRVKPNSEQVKFILSALEDGHSQQIDRPPATFVEDLFDQYAPYYEKHLQDTLNFKVPHLIMTMLESNKIVSTNNKLSVLDLGCGSGLMGMLLKPFCSELVGLDLSAKMLDLAEQKGCYQRLIHGDFCEPNIVNDSFELIVASDVIPYTGNIDQLLSFLKKRLLVNAHLCFSYELSSEQAEYQLDKTLRYKHAKTYIHKQLEIFGFDLVDVRDAVLRTNHKQPIEGSIVLAKLAVLH